MRALCCTSTVTGVRTKCLKPCFSTSIRYWPGNRFTNVKSPSLPLDCVRFSAVPRLVSVTLASVTVAPEVSVTEPAIEPKVDCAYADRHDPATRKFSDRTIVQNLRVSICPPADVRE